MRKIQLFHGTTFSRAMRIKAEGPSIAEVRPLDFGAGFYATMNEGQALQWAFRKARHEKDAPFVLSFDIDLSLLEGLEFDGMSKGWLDFVYCCRKLRLGYSFDYVCGPMCDGNMKLAMLAQTREEFDHEVKASNIGFQYCLHTQKAVDAIKWR